MKLGRDEKEFIIGMIMLIVMSFIFVAIKAI